MVRILLIVTLLVSAVAATAQDVPSSPLSTNAPIGPRDVVEVKVFQDPSLNTRATVTDDGKLAMPLLGKVDVAGLTPVQVEARIKALLEARYITKADVAVEVVEAGNKPISIVGSVVHPGRIGITGNITLMQAITQAGGLATGYGPQLYVLRTGENGMTDKIAIDINELMVNGNPDVNLPLYPNDVINVPADTPITIYVSGEVMHPGVVQFRRSQSPTLLQAIAGAGGPTDRASKVARVKRFVDGKEQSIKANFRDIISGKKSDVLLLDSDTVWIDESVF